MSIYEGIPDLHVHVDNLIRMHTAWVEACCRKVDPRELYYCTIAQHPTREEFWCRHQLVGTWSVTWSARGFSVTSRIIP